MGKRYNENFLGTYIELDKICCEKFGVISGGVTEYINRLNNARFAPNRDEVLPRLVRYRNLRNRFAHEPGAIRRTDDIVKDDIRWLSHFRKDVNRRRDPISRYLRKARRYALKRKLKRFFILFLCAAVVTLGTILYFVLTK